MKSPSEYRHHAPGTMRLTMTRLTLAAAALAAVLSFGSGPARAAGDAPWCAVHSMGAGTAYWDCQYQTLEQCVPEVIAGLRGFCNQNPRWEGWYAKPAQPRAVHPRKKRHRKAD
jgi:hypothetical protein